MSRYIDADKAKEKKCIVKTDMNMLCLLLN